MKKRRMTRNSFKRKVVLFGIMAFMSIALVATGFAAWVISGNASNELNHNVTIGAVSNKSMTMQLNSTEADIFFECDENDTTGRIRKDNETTKFEKLSVVVSGYIYDAVYLDSITIKINLPDSVIAAAGSDSAPKYIKLPANYDQTITLNKLPDGTTGFTGGEGYYIVDGEDTLAGMKVAYFQYTVSFEWGEFFGGVNPGYWYDGVNKDGSALTDLTGKGKDVDVALQEMAAFKALVENGGTAAPISIIVEAIAG